MTTSLAGISKLILFTGSLIFILILVRHTGYAQETNDRPNILWIVSEDTSPLMGCYGDTYATTPFIDKLAQTGVLYQNAFATAPVCALARSTIITGLHASTMGTDNMRSDYPIPAFIKFFPRYLREAGYYTTNNAKKDYNTIDQRNAWDESSTKATYKNRKPGQPFFAVFNLGMTHESRIHRTVARLNHDPAKVVLPPYHPDTKEVREDWALFYDNIQQMDKQVGRLLAELEEAGLAESTIVFYYSDHGGVIARSKRFMYDAGLRVPLIVRIPKRYAALSKDTPGSKTERMVTFADFASTVLNVAGLRIPDYMEGSPFLGHSISKERVYAYALRGRIDESIEFIRGLRDKRYRYIRNYMPQRIYGQPNEYLFQARSIVSWQKSYLSGSLNNVQSAFWKVKPAEELYDVFSDPHNVNNLAENPSYKAVLERIRKESQQNILRNKDTGFIPESMKVNISERSTSYDFARSDQYPLERILETAEMATMRDADNMQKIVARLSDSNPLIRYWAAMGCAILPKTAVSSKEKLKALVTDPEPAVRVAAAEALYKIGEKAIAVNTLGKQLSSDNRFLRLEALTVLENMGGDAQPALGQIKNMIDLHGGKQLKSAPSWKAEHDIKVANRILSAKF